MPFLLTTLPTSLSSTTDSIAVYPADEIRTPPEQSGPAASKKSPIKGGSQGRHPPPSTTSTDATCVAVESSAGMPVSSGTSVAGQKRLREEDDEEVDRPESVRARTESYKPQDVKPMGLWSWLKLPWETFKRGFTEGLEGRGN